MMWTVTTPITAEDLAKIEAEMKKIVKENLAITRFTKPRAEAIEFFKEKNEPYKVELDRGSSGRFGDQLLSAGRVCGSLCRSSSDDNKAGKSI